MCVALRQMELSTLLLTGPAVREILSREVALILKFDSKKLEQQEKRTLLGGRIFQGKRTAVAKDLKENQAYQVLGPEEVSGVG